ncbi:hypothetical protein AVT69_gp104 [Pseudomonas phage PhiPA3]|uniref:Uncharacterized protein 105 n=1 Tax=Pseudomonas phage PhiPA3 TaxID=998086 RepID=F8SJL3_BPPA3|nr:hypothetical protein AVT69_gp104 [Pseudomonas phage PhiPA3]AEH03529.1 hypothetical protein [Pseudomonas phage PhiPA3]
MNIKLCDRRTAAWRLFHLQFPAVAPYMAGFSAEYLRDNAINGTGDKYVDRDRQNELVRTSLTAAAMAMLMGQGYTIGLLNFQDCVQIYHDIQQHFADWRDQCVFGAHPSGFPPIEDLRLFEDLALEVHGLAKKLEPAGRNSSHVFDSLLMMARKRNLTATNRYFDGLQKNDGQLKPYVSIVDDIERYVVESQDVR